MENNLEALDLDKLQLSLNLFLIAEYDINIKHIENLLKIRKDIAFIMTKTYSRTEQYKHLLIEFEKFFIKRFFNIKVNKL